MAKAGAFPAAAAIRALVNENGILQVHVIPNARHTELRLPGGCNPRVLHIRITPAPEDGKANKEVIRIVAKALGIAKSKITLERGATSREKQLRVTVSVHRAATPVPA